MSAWNFMSYESKANLLEAVRRESAGMFALAEESETWMAPTGAGDWQVRDVFGHLIDTTETYFVGFDAARKGTSPPDSAPLRDMATHVDRGARQFRTLERKEALDRLATALDRMLGITENLSEQEWSGLLVPHKYMGPLPAFFYPVFQLVDYAVHSWDIRQGIGRPHALEAQSADLLVPLCFVLWSATPLTGPEARPIELGIRITSGANAGDTRVAIGPSGAATTPGPLDGLSCIIEFDPGSFVLTAYGRTNAGTARGDRDLAHQFLGGFFRI
ncbi:maleylpyruvate isomerase family mycothiol-dependent enzyme [Actinoplanes sp. KI2]|uniref:maleylpyruvate isomerase family mycothiol-dependent enzyme n=1 Tax=Actinoplanes sp. KI2 TaxID=2983315 RepID=UPI0021D5C4C1|nr:maleylpyruvate isomerase family mycothiol-dependent enzyme [Actinoplanes sp. KI2]MCU7724041.1 maleylpyruvate isomerase family mycothiol-dependent enzyme [Actinoplanes sp. KI2]